MKQKQSNEASCLKLPFHTKKADWGFIVPSTLIWGSSLLVTAWDFVYLQAMIYRFGLINALGLGLFLTGIPIRLAGKRTLGKSYSYGLKPPEKLIKHGMYEHVRHPIYLAMLLYTAGIPLFFSSLYGFTPTLGFVPLILYRIKIEEKMLIEKFRDQYREYMKNTKKLIPFIY
jgi:protein-S-isoprenylcysteine O-methyltransferase Ste14